MRLSRVVLVASLVVAFGSTAHASGPDPDDYVTVDVNGPIVCVREDCEQPEPLVEICVVPLGLCAAK